MANINTATFTGNTLKEGTDKKSKGLNKATFTGNPQIKSQQYDPVTFVGSTGIGDSQFDTGVPLSQLENLDIIRANRQPGIHQATNALFGGLGSGVMTAIEDIGYILDIPNNVNRLFGTEEVSSNALSDWAKDNKESWIESLPVYRKRPGQTFDWKDSGFYWEAFRGVVDSAVGFGLVGMGAASAVKGVGAALRAAGQAGRVSRLKAWTDIAGKSFQQGQAGNIGAALITNYGEGKMMALELYEDSFDRTLESMIEDYQTKNNGEEPDQDTLDRFQRESSKIAGDAANDFQLKNLMFMATDYFQLGSIFKGARGTRNMMSKPGMKNFWKDQLKTAPKEGLEEIGQNVFQMEGQYESEQALRDLGVEVNDPISTSENWGERFLEFATSDQALLEGMMGLFGGPVQYAVTKAPFTDKSGQMKKYSDQQSVIQKNKEFFQSKLSTTATRAKEIQENLNSDEPKLAELYKTQEFDILALENFVNGTTENLESILNEELKSPDYTEEEKQDIQSKIERLTEMESEFNRFQKYNNAGGIYQNRLQKRQTDDAVRVLDERIAELSQEIESQYSGIINTYNRGKETADQISFGDIQQAIATNDFTGIPKSIRESLLKNPEVQKFTGFTKSRNTVERRLDRMQNRYNDMTNIDYGLGYSIMEKIVQSTTLDTEEKIDQLSKLEKNSKHLDNNTLSTEIRLQRAELGESLRVSKERIETKTTPEQIKAAIKKGNLKFILTPEQEFLRDLPKEDKRQLEKIKKGLILKEQSEGIPKAERQAGNLTLKEINDAINEDPSMVDQLLQIVDDYNALDAQIKAEILEQQQGEPDLVIGEDPVTPPETTTPVGEVFEEDLEIQRQNELKELPKSLKGTTTLRLAEEQINAKYDALKEASTPPGEVFDEGLEAQKADIERRRRISLGGITQTSLNFDAGRGYVGRYNIKGTEIIDSHGKPSTLFEQTETVREETKEEVEQEINAKYDAELAALESQTVTIITTNEIVESQDKNTPDDNIETHNYKSQGSEVLREVDGKTENSNSEVGVKVSNFGMDDFYTWLENGQNKTGEKVDYQIDFNNKLANAKKAVGIYNKYKDNKSSVSQADIDYMVDNLPIRMRSQSTPRAAGFLYVVRPGDTMNATVAERNLRRQIIDSIASGQTPVGTIEGQYGGNLKVSDKEVEDSILDIPDYRNLSAKDINIFYVDGEGFLKDSKTRASITDKRFVNTRVTLKATGKPMTGALFVMVNKLNGESFPLKVNAADFTSTEKRVIKNLLLDLIKPQEGDINTLNKPVRQSILDIIPEIDREFLDKGVTYKDALNFFVYEGKRSQSNPVTQLYVEGGTIYFGDNTMNLDDYMTKEGELDEFLDLYKNRNIDLKRLQNDLKYKEHIINNGFITTDADTSGNSLFRIMDTQGMKDSYPDMDQRIANRYRSGAVYVKKDIDNPISTPVETRGLKGLEADIERRRREELNILEENAEKQLKIQLEKNKLKNFDVTFESEVSNKKQLDENLNEVGILKNVKTITFEIKKNENLIAFASFWKDIDGKWYANNINILDKNQRRKGIMSYVYNNFINAGYDLKPSKEQTEEGVKFWESINISNSPSKKINNKYDSELVALEEETKPLEVTEKPSKLPTGTVPKVSKTEATQSNNTKMNNKLNNMSLPKTGTRRGGLNLNAVQQANEKNQAKINETLEDIKSKDTKDNEINCPTKGKGKKGKK